MMEITGEEEEAGARDMEILRQGNHLNTITEIEEETPDHFRIEESGDDVYVAVGDCSSSMAALTWTLNHAVNPSTFVYLIHIFPEIHRIPSPLGMLPKERVRPEQVEFYVNQERNKRIALLEKYLKCCNAHKVRADTILIESDATPKAVLDLIHILNIRKLVVGTSKSSLRKLKEGNGKAEQIYRSAPDFCRVKIICQGKDLTGNMITPSPSDASDCRSETSLESDDNKKQASWLCFSSKF